MAPTPEQQVDDQVQHDRSRTPRAPRPRDAEQTRRSLIEAAQRRFARDGYAATTVRQIAEDAGVNVALINRYFQSKEGLFETCLSSAAGVLAESAEDVTELTQLAAAIADRVIVASAHGDLANTLLLLLRSSGDERAEQIRVDVLRAFGEMLAEFAGWAPGQPGADHLLLRAQLILGLAIGIVVLRSSGLEPMASVSSDQLGVPMGELVSAALGGLTPPPRP